MSEIEPGIGLKQNWGVEEIYLVKESLCLYADIERGSSEASRENKTYTVFCMVGRHRVC